MLLIERASFIQIFISFIWFHYHWKDCIVSMIHLPSYIYSMSKANWSRNKVLSYPRPLWGESKEVKDTIFFTKCNWNTQISFSGLKMLQFISTRRFLYTPRIFDGTEVLVPNEKIEFKFKFLIGLNRKLALQRREIYG